MHLCMWVCVGLGGGAHALAFARLHAVCRSVVASVCGRVGVGVRSRPCICMHIIVVKHNVSDYIIAVSFWLQYMIGCAA